jgi:hypothetical protein
LTHAADISRDLETALTEQYACEKAPDAGEFYRIIRQHQHSGHTLFERQWWARLEAVGPRRKQNLDRILKHSAYRSAFDCQLDMPGLAGGMNLGTVHEMFAMGCNEVCFSARDARRRPHCVNVCRRIFAISGTSETPGPKSSAMMYGR